MCGFLRACVLNPRPQKVDPVLGLERRIPHSTSDSSLQTITAKTYSAIYNISDMQMTHYQQQKIKMNYKLLSVANRTSNEYGLKIISLCNIWKSGQSKQEDIKRIK